MKNEKMWSTNVRISTVSKTSIYFTENFHLSKHTLLTKFLFITLME